MGLLLYPIQWIRGFFGEAGFHGRHDDSVTQGLLSDRDLLEQVREFSGFHDDAAFPRAIGRPAPGPPRRLRTPV
jgi:hypothetical protein